MRRLMKKINKENRMACKHFHVKNGDDCHFSETYNPGNMGILM